MTGKIFHSLLRPLIIFGGLLIIWQLVVWATGAPHYILPSPLRVLSALQGNFPLLMFNAGVTLTEIILGLLLGTLLGGCSALLISSFAPLRRWLLPVLVVSQAIPVFALAPVLVLWIGYGMSSKVAMAVLIIYFPVTAAFFDGLRRTDPGWLDLARTMDASAWTLLWRIRVPAALPALASGLRVATAVAPIGAVVGEWVGASSGLGHLMLYSNARMQIDLLFAALFILALMALTLYYSVDRLCLRMTPWSAEKH